MAIRTTTRYFFLALGVFAAAAIAVQDGQPGRFYDRAPAVATDLAPAACVTGSPAGGAYDIKYAAVAAPATTSRSYDIDAGFRSANAVGSAMTLQFSPGGEDMGEYASFKCQYTCNGTPGCVSFFGRLVQVNSTTEHYECLSFGALLDQSAFTLQSHNTAVGGFNKLCK
ncbi:hypothetical protein VSDG_06575 [Cytospora chrysosperma]|uniref:Uncharacterized protein n=1 Tax=Cytospora chrysosperma TaxID=252740 RepID=A0A423VNV0_CYTCH|nr:hypothetical protein VSDG_06575 [Valsa sordida]